jgi:hypothetical protein
MKTVINKQTETIKKSIDSVSQNSKETIKLLIDSNAKQFDSLLEANKKTFDSVSKILHEKEMDPSFVSNLKNTYTKSVKLSEDVIDSIIDSHTKRIEQSIDFVNRFMEIIKNEDIGSKEGNDKLIELAKENLDRSTELSMKNMEKIVSSYGDHLNVALSFNRKFADNLNSQITSMFKLQKKSMDNFFPMEMVTDWWKNGEEKVKA